jgi:hypothetical protein
MSPPAPFHCVAFSITARKRGGFRRRAQWQVDAGSVVWDDLFVVPNGRDRYDEDEFRRLAALSGWRLVRIVTAGGNERRLYFTRGASARTGTESEPR